MDGAAQLPFRQGGEPTLDQVDPGRPSGREVPRFASSNLAGEAKHDDSAKQGQLRSSQLHRHIASARYTRLDFI
jgi:hypothetical protein